MAKPLYVVGAMTKSGKRWHPAFVKPSFVKGGRERGEGYASFTDKKYALRVAKELERRFPKSRIKLLKVV
jgi:hypothetical protein